MFKIKFLKTATLDLAEISNYIALDNPFQSKIVLQNIYSNIKYLEMFPFLWKERKDWLRELIAKHKYRVFYRIEKNNILIISVFKYKDIY